MTYRLVDTIVLTFEQNAILYFVCRPYFCNRNCKTDRIGDMNLKIVSVIILLLINSSIFGQNNNFTQLQGENMNRMIKVAAAQLTPIFLDKEKTTQKACKAIIEAGENGANLIVWIYRKYATY